MNSLRRFVALISAVLVLAACSGHHSARTVARTTKRGSKGSWIGTVDGTNALIGLTSDGYELTAYLCDSAKISSWFRGPAADGRPDITNDAGNRLTATLTGTVARGRFVTAAGEVHTFTAHPSSVPVLWRAHGTIATEPMLAGWVVDPSGEQRGAVSLGTTVQPAPILTPSPLLVTNVSLADPSERPVQVQAAAILPDSQSIVTPNTTGFPEFVLLGFGDSYGAGDGNPFKSANNTVSQGSGLPGSTPWEKLAALGSLAASAAFFAPALGAFTGVAGATAAVGARLAGENSVPELPLVGTEGVEQWGANGSPDCSRSDAAPDCRNTSAPADERYRVICHRGVATAEKVFQRLRDSGDYPGLKFVFYNFGCSGSTIRHIVNQPYDGVHDNSRNNALSSSTPTNQTDQIPPELSLARAFIGDQSTDSATSTARTFLTNQHVAFPQLSTPHIDATYISAGGNDFAFGDIVEKCAIFPLPDCDNSNEGAVQQNGLRGAFPIQSTIPAKLSDVTAAALGDDSTMLGLNKAHDSYKQLRAALDALKVTANGHVTTVTPSHVYLGEYPDPGVKSQTVVNAPQLCDNHDPGLEDDTLGLFTATDALFGHQALVNMDGAVDHAAADNATANADGRGAWEAVPNQNAFAGHAICSAQPDVLDGAAALKTTGNDLGIHGIFDISGAVMHPNDAGYSKLADGLEPMVKEQVDNMVSAAPAKPTRVRQVSASLEETIQLRWDDNANNEAYYNVLDRPAGSNGAFNRVSGNITSDTSSFVPTFTHHTNGPQTNEYIVRACTRWNHCTDSAPIVATDEAPVAPSGIAAHVVKSSITQEPLSVVVSWAGQAKNPSASVVIRVQSASDKIGEFAVTGTTASPVTTFTLDHPVDPNASTIVGDYTIRVRGCNLLGCSATGDAVKLTVEAAPKLIPRSTLPPLTNGP